MKTYINEAAVFLMGISVVSFASQKTTDIIVPKKHPASLRNQTVGYQGNVYKVQDVRQRKDRKELVVHLSAISRLISDGVDVTFKRSHRNKPWQESTSQKTQVPTKLGCAIYGGSYLGLLILGLCSNQSIPADLKDYCLWGHQHLC